MRCATKSARPPRRMKPSGITWLGDVPEEWELIKGKYCLRQINRPIKDGDGVITCFRDGEVTLRSKRREEGFTISMKEIGYQGIEPGDLVVHGMDGFAGSIGVSDSRGKASPVLIVLDTEQDKKFLMYYLRTVAYKNVFVGLATGIRVRSCDLRWPKLAELPYLLPPLLEQRAIAERIDCEVARVDALREKIKREIECLGDYKKSLIAETVTRGLRKRKMKPSGILWLGDVPAEWEVTRIGYLATRKPPKYAPEEELLSVFLDRGVIRFADGGSKRANVASGDFSKYQLVEPGDFVLNNQQAWRGSVGVSTYRGIISPAYLILKTKSVVDAVYANYLFRSRPLVALYEQCSHGVGSIQRNIYWDELRVQKIPFPSLPEQREIAEYLDRAVSRIDAVVAQRKSQLEKLEAFKRSLIQEYVTGKREVCQ